MVLPVQQVLHGVHDVAPTGAPLGANYSGSLPEVLQQRALMPLQHILDALLSMVHPR